MTEVTTANRFAFRESALSVAQMRADRDDERYSVWHTGDQYHVVEGTQAPTEIRRRSSLVRIVRPGDPFEPSGPQAA